jgi:hypothetical protein
MGINELTSTMVSAKEVGLGMLGVEVMRGREVQEEVSMVVADTSQTYL